MSFFETEFPRDIAILAKGGAAFFTTLNEQFSGGEQSNRNWAKTRGQWTIDLNHKPQEYFDKIYAFFLVVGGMADPFRFFEHKDCNMTNTVLGTGDGANKDFQLVRNYVCNDRAYVRVITKPITSEVKDFQGNSLPNTVKVYKAGVLQGSGFTVDHTTGIVHFTVAPAVGVVVSADAQYHIPVRFMNDSFEGQIEMPNPDGDSEDPLITCPGIQLREVKL